LRLAGREQTGYYKINSREKIFLERLQIFLLVGMVTLGIRTRILHRQELLGILH